VDCKACFQKGLVPLGMWANDDSNKMTDAKHYGPDEDDENDDGNNNKGGGNDDNNNANKDKNADNNNINNDANNKGSTSDAAAPLLMIEEFQSAQEPGSGFNIYSSAHKSMLH
jgi:hypothetical protein